MPVPECTHEGLYLVDFNHWEACYDCCATFRGQPALGAKNRSVISPDVIAQIVEAVRAGVTPFVAATTAGVKGFQWVRWRQSKKPENEALQEAVNQAEAYAVSTALRMVKAADPKAWLKHATQIEGVWREVDRKVSVEVGGSGVPIQIATTATPSLDYSKLSAQDLAQLEQLLSSARAETAPLLLPAANPDVDDAEFTEE